MSPKNKTRFLAGLDKSKKENRNLAIVMMLINCIILAAIVLFFSLYNNRYKVSLNNENLENISTINQSASNIANSSLRYHQRRVADICQYVLGKPMDIDEVLRYISESNLPSDDGEYQLVLADYSCYAIVNESDNSYVELDYSYGDYSKLHKLFNVAGRGVLSGIIDCTPEFTDNRTGIRSFAVFSYLNIIDEQGNSCPCTLMYVMHLNTLVTNINTSSSYDGIATMIMDEKGNYILSHDEFKRNNFFEYIYTYNGLTLDEQNALRDATTATESGKLYYLNSHNADCVYVYSRMESNSWYCVTAVPMSSFHVYANAANFTILCVLMLLALFIVDLCWLMSINRRLEASMEHANIANRAKSDFLSRMSHEIRTPLNAVIGYNTIAQSVIPENRAHGIGTADLDKVRDCLTKSDIASKHLLSVINDVLDMSSIESGKMNAASEKFDFPQMLSSLSPIFYAQAANAGNEFEVFITNSVDERFIGDQLRLNQILTNLLNNAVKFTPSGGRVTLTIEQNDIDDEQTSLKFVVADSGIGMSAEYLARIWKPFEQADSSISRKYGGSGLGLSITKRLVEMLKGSISVESEPGKGTTFTVVIPLLKAPQDRIAIRPDDFSAVHALLVDDDADTREYMALLMNRCGVRNTTVASGVEAIKAAKAAHEANDDYTLCLMDWRMPGLSGIETVREMRSSLETELPVVIISAYDYSSIEKEAKELGVTSFISKPFFQSTFFDFLVDFCSGDNRMTNNGTLKQFKGVRVLLAEDNEMNMEIACEILGFSGLEVSKAWNGREAVDVMLASKAGTFSAILMDVHMPEMNGLDAARAIRSSNHPQAKTIPILAMTADAFDENVSQAIEAGMNDHIAKPIDVDLLFDKLQNYIN